MGVDGLTCAKCGAVGEAKDRKRFLRRHPKLCTARRKFNEHLAGGTRSVGTSQEEDVHLYRLEKIEAEGRNLTERERDFVSDLRDRVDRFGNSGLVTEKMAKWLEDIYANRT